MALNPRDVVIVDGVRSAMGRSRNARLSSRDADATDAATTAVRTRRNAIGSNAARIS